MTATPIEPPSSRRKSDRAAKSEPDVDEAEAGTPDTAAEEEDEADAPESSSSRRGGKRSRIEIEEERSIEGEEPGKTLRLRKSVSYREIPVDVDEEPQEVDGEEEVGEAEDDGWDFLMPCSGGALNG